MSIGEKLLIVFGVALSLILPTFTSMVYALDVPSTVEIEAVTCGLEFSAGSATTLDYGLISPDEISAHSNAISVDNTGNTAGDAYIAGTDWKDGPGATQMLVGVTHYQVTTSVAYAASNVLTSTPLSIGSMSPASSFSLVFQVKGVLENPGFFGPLTQQVFYSTEC